jgi:hypothetical protein
MKYKYVNGPVFCRYAGTPPIINSRLAEEYGIEASSFVELEQGRNVKVRMVLENRTRKMSCHAKVAWVKRDYLAAGAFDNRWIVGLNSLSLTNAEFHVLLANFVEEPECPLELRERLRDEAADTPSVVLPGKEDDVVRIKAVTLPVAVIDMIDAKRGDVQSSQFIVEAVKEYLKGRLRVRSHLFPGGRMGRSPRDVELRHGTR